VQGDIKRWALFLEWPVACFPVFGRRLALAQAQAQAKAKEKNQKQEPAKQNRWPPWWVGGSEYEKGTGSDLFCRYFFRVFELTSPRLGPRNAQKRDKKSRKSALNFWSIFL
jgi:hypothetical protein